METGKRLSTVRIRSFKGIKDWEIDLKPGVYLIKGINGEGFNQGKDIEEHFLDNKVKYKTGRDEVDGY